MRWTAIRRAAVPLTVAAGLLAPATLPAVASPAAYSISVSATDSAGSYYGYTLVFYKATGGYETASVSGKVTGAQAGDVAVLLARPFGAKSYSPAGKHVTIVPHGTGAVRYSFAVTPALATSYKVEVLTGTTVDVTSRARTVYVAAGGFGKPARVRCARGHCTMTWQLGTLMPPSAYKTEAAKKWYLYLTVSAGTPTTLPLVRGDRVSKPRRVNAGAFVQTLTYRFSSRQRDPARRLHFEACTKDSEARDGIGLPRGTGCGSRRIYLGYVG